MEATIDRDALHRYVDRVLLLHEERKSINAEIAEVYDEAKTSGFVPAVIRQIVRERQMDADERLDHYALLDTYRHALGMLADTPLGDAAMATAKMPVERPRPFAEQPVHRPRGRPRNGEPSSHAGSAGDVVDDMIDTANRIRGRGRPRKGKDADPIGEPADAA